MVNAQALQGQWNQIRGDLKKKWGQLTDDDLRFTNGNIDQLIGKIQQRTGEAREAIEQFLTESTSQGASAISQAAGQVGQYARQATDRELRHQRDGEAHRRGEAQLAAPQRADPVEDLHARRHGDEHRRQRERGNDVQRGPSDPDQLHIYAQS